MPPPSEPAVDASRQTKPDELGSISHAAVVMDLLQACRQRTRNRCSWDRGTDSACGRAPLCLSPQFLDVAYKLP